MPQYHGKWNEFIEKLKKYVNDHAKMLWYFSDCMICTLRGI